METKIEENKELNNCENNVTKKNREKNKLSNFGITKFQVEYLKL